MARVSKPMITLGTLLPFIVVLGLCSVYWVYFRRNIRGCVSSTAAQGLPGGEVYSALIQHIRGKFLDNTSLGLAGRRCLDYAWKMLDQVKAKVAAIPGLVEGIIEYAN